MFFIKGSFLLEYFYHSNKEKRFFIRFAIIQSYKYVTMNVNNVETSFLDYFLCLITVLFFHKYSFTYHYFVLLPLYCRYIYCFNKMP